MRARNFNEKPILCTLEKKWTKCKWTLALFSVGYVFLMPVNTQLPGWSHQKFCLYQKNNTTNYDHFLFFFFFSFLTTMTGLQNSTFWAIFRVHSFPEESCVTTAVSPWREPHHRSISSFWIHFPLSKNLFRSLIILTHGTNGIYKADMYMCLCIQVDLWTHKARSCAPRCVISSSQTNVYPSCRWNCWHEKNNCSTLKAKAKSFALHAVLLL